MVGPHLGCTTEREKVGTQGSDLRFRINDLRSQMDGVGAGIGSC